MYPLKALLVGCQGETLADVRRELTKLAIDIEAEVPDVDACLREISAHPSDQRLLVAHPGTTIEMRKLERLVGSSASQPILVLLDSGNDPFLVTSWGTRSGTAEAIELPFRPDDLRSAIHRLFVQSPQATSHCRSVVVLGATEGVGCTTIAVNLACELARMQKGPCILAEQAVAFGRLANYLGICPKVTLFDLVSDLEHMDEERMREALTPIDENLQVLVGSYRHITPFTITPEVAFKALACAMQLCETVVVDARHHFEEVDFDFAAKAQHVVLVAKPTTPSLHSMRALLEMFSQRGCVGQRHVVINQYVDSVDAISKQTIKGHLNDDHVIFVAADPIAIETAETSGRLLHKSTPDSEALEDVSNLARNILGIAPQLPPRQSFRESLKRMARALHLR